ncbi:Helix-turn-helix domain protein [Adhaeretor mobilis]|uniref:Helix-turn-helix domain protein n=1 Tax=Adhaeretor mobilis TaxID=1930276 RepID=A0A517MVY9_9BACT|nr:Helix-turn-helix domain protein [Adhaeretor mobilis]
MKIANTDFSGKLLINGPVAAKVLGLPERTLFTLRKRDNIPFAQIGRSIRYCPQELDTWIDENSLIPSPSMN